MRIRYRLILSFLILAFIPLSIMVIQVNLEINRGRNLVNDRLSQSIDKSGEGLILNGEGITRSLNEEQVFFEEVMRSVKYHTNLWGLLIALGMVITGIWLANRFSFPIEKIAEKTSRILQMFHKFIGNASINEVRAAISYENIQKDKPLIKEEESRVNNILDILESGIEEQFTFLEKQARSGKDELKQLSAQFLDLEKIVHESSEALGADRILSNVAQQISQKFGFYHVGFYLLDDSGEFLELRAAASGSVEGQESQDSEGIRQKLIDKNYRLRVSDGKNHRVDQEQSQGIPGYVAVTGEIYQSADLSQDVRALRNPDLPSARSEIALPLIIHGEVVGVLDVQSTRQNQFTTDEIALLHVIADQTALVVENTRLTKQFRQAQEAERRAYGEITRIAWDEMTRSRPEWGYRSEEEGIFRVEGDWHPKMVQAVQQGQVVVWQDSGYSIASVPVRVRDYTLGVLDFRKAGEADIWTTEELALVQTLTDQLGQALESARLYQNTQLRAERERILADITSKVRASTNVNVILQTAVKELAEALRVPKGAIQLRSANSEARERKINPNRGGQDNA